MNNIQTDAKGRAKKVIAFGSPKKKKMFNPPCWEPNKAYGSMYYELLASAN